MKSINHHKFIFFLFPSILLKVLFLVVGFGFLEFLVVHGFRHHLLFIVGLGFSPSASAPLWHQNQVARPSFVCLYFRLILLTHLKELFISQIITIVDLFPESVSPAVLLLVILSFRCLNKPARNFIIGHQPVVEEFPAAIPDIVQSFREMFVNFFLSFIPFLIHFTESLKFLL
jgi:hypothetical protein